MLGHGGGAYSKIKCKTLNETPDARGQQFFENQLSMRIHKNSFVGFGKCVFGQQLYTNIFEKCYGLINIFHLNVYMVRQC